MQVDVRVEKGQYPTFSQEEFAGRYDRIRKKMESTGLDCLLIYGTGRYQPHLVYVGHYKDRNSAYIVFPLKGEPTLIVAMAPYTYNARMVSPIKDVRWGGPPGEVPRTVVQRVIDLGCANGNIGLVDDESDRRWPSIPYDHMDTFKQMLPKAKLSMVTEMLEELRAVKSKEEINFIQRGAEITDTTMEAMIEKVRPGITELELYGETVRAAYKSGGVFQFLLLGSTSMKDPSMPFPWPTPSYRRIRHGDVILNELGVEYGNYAGQLIRPIFLGNMTKEYEMLYEAALRTYKGVKATLKSGNSTKDILAVSSKLKDEGLTMEAISTHGFDGIFTIPNYHVATSSEHEYWKIRKFFPLKENMGIMIEPNPCTVDRKMGVFLGDLNLVTENGGYAFHKFPLDPVIL